MKNNTKFIYKFYISSLISLFAIILLAPGQEVSAASAVAFDASRSVYGYSYNYADQQQARNAALRSCQRRGGRSCRIIASCGGKGFGVLYFRRLPGQPIRAIGASCGAATVDQAREIARYYCHRLGKGRCSGPKVGWNDTVGTRYQGTNKQPVYRRTTPNQPVYRRNIPVNHPPRPNVPPVSVGFSTNIRQKIIPGSGFAVVANFRWQARGGAGPLKVSVQVKSSITHRNWRTVLSNQSAADVGSWMVSGVPGERFHFRAVARDGRGRIVYSRIISF